VRVVLDTNTVVSALLWGGIPEQLLAAATEGRIELYTSESLFMELAEVLARPKFAQRIQKAGRTVRHLLEQYRGLAEFIEPATITPGAVADPDDDHVLACALGARADLIVSGDAHLLNLKAFQGIAIVTAGDALTRLAQR
jgi:putative PIN family toxin of toxin-antitoxin system